MTDLKQSFAQAHKSNPKNIYHGAGNQCNLEPCYSEMPRNVPDAVKQNSGLPAYPDEGINKISLHKPPYKYFIQSFFSFITYS
jgi:hypothetical protein